MVVAKVVLPGVDSLRHRGASPHRVIARATTSAPTSLSFADAAVALRPGARDRDNFGLPIFDFGL
jgi:hypothetical protein